MRKQLLLHLGVVLAVAAMATVAYAGDYHFGVDLVCQDCHVMHYSQSHGYNPNGGGIYVQPGAGGPFHYLLRDDINDLCLACHDGQPFAPDVFESHSNGYVRQAGALNELGGNGLYPEATGHTLNSTDLAPGGTFANADGLNCADCHSVHGRASGLPVAYAAQGGYRNLFRSGTASISYTRGDVEGANDLGAWVYEDASGGVNAQHYGYTGITFNEPDQTASAYATFCKSCHTDFHGAVGGPEIGGVGSPAEEFVRHPSAGQNIGALGGGHSALTQLTGRGNNVQVMSPLGQKAGVAGGYDGTDTGLTMSCMSCHKAHGNQNAFGLIYMLGTGTITEQGDDGTDARNLCRQCHRMGGTSTTW